MSIRNNARVIKKRFTKAQNSWYKDYTETFHGIEPIMGIEEFETGTMTWLEYVAYNLCWITEHTEEQVKRLDGRKS